MSGLGGPVYQLRLFVTGRSPESVRASENLERICRTDLAGRCHVEIVDVLEDRDLAHDQRILATPTLVRRSPGPERRIIGDLSNREKVLAGLGLLTESVGSARRGDR